ncbi:MAG: glycosyltransferase [Verrucomicrobiota bacterium]
MRILHTIATIDPATGGPARSVPQLLIALKAAGLDVSLWTAEPPEAAWLMALRERKIPIHSGDLNFIPSFDLIHDHGLWLMNNHRVATYAGARKIPRVVSPRGMLEPWALNHKNWKKRAAWWLYQRRDLRTVAALHATAGSEARQFRKLGLKAPIIELPNGVEIPESREQRAECEESVGELGETRRSSGWHGRRQSKSEDASSLLSALCPPPSTLKTALFLSRIHPKKGLPLLVGAWAKVRPAGWRMIVVGPDEGGHRAEVQTMVREHGLTDAWEFRDACEGPAKVDLLHRADLFILPTHSENFGIAVAEALAAGTPVITTTGAPWQGLLDHHCGWWVEPAMEPISGALAEGTNKSTAELAEMGGRGRRWVEAEFAWPGIASRMAEAYGKIVATGAL